ncbi:peptidoglycan editing factor PgeF [Desulfitobacterium sp.]|uniref:peptidoglycan editing factor PgeF n=1 Tax=Desulfitobacterium sp. TaxID=49981 RepID=UPI002B205A04|nr:peptidoglycan editing factor PgeF [Desulfitobacterium sp.]MEA4900065.1 peptidoglycan editing factor PgeF [Desulfitobacterium sp.]
MGWCFRQGKRLTYLTLPEWEECGIQVGFSTRWGGIGRTPYESLNLGLHVGDDQDRVLRNRELWLQEWDAEWNDFVIGEQVHDVKVQRVEPADAGRGGRDIKTVLPGVDGLVTTSSLGLMAFFADCVPVFFYHPTLKAVSIAHAGWRGTVGKIAHRVLLEFQNMRGNISDCWVALGPSIGACCYEVDERVINLFQEAFKETPFIKPSRPGHAQLDLWEANRQLLLEAGAVPEHIWSASICTSCHTDSFFSHRREGPKTGRMAGWIRRKD